MKFNPLTSKIFYSLTYYSLHISFDMLILFCLHYSLINFLTVAAILVKYSTKLYAKRLERKILVYKNSSFNSIFFFFHFILEFLDAEAFLTLT